MWLPGSRAQAQQLWRTGLVAPQHVGSSRTRPRTCVPCIGRWILNHCATGEAPFSPISEPTGTLLLWPQARQAPSSHPHPGARNRCDKTRAGLQCPVPSSVLSGCSVWILVLAFWPHAARARGEGTRDPSKVGGAEVCVPAGQGQLAGLSLSRVAGWCWFCSNAGRHCRFVMASGNWSGAPSKSWNGSGWHLDNGKPPLEAA